MKITKEDSINESIRYYIAETGKYRVVIKTDCNSYMKKLSYKLYKSIGEYTHLQSQMIWISYADNAPNKIIERMIKRLESIYNI